ncbi:MAG: alternative ribosome rescue aminoacyl-tRNA hydrolase ArfB [Planctomycetota bacterium]
MQPSPQRDREVSLAPGLPLTESAVAYRFSRGHGPGGQNVNKVNSHVTMTVPLSALAEVMPGDAVDRLRTQAGRYLAASPERLVIHASDHRSQLANRRACLAKLRRLLIQAMQRPRTRRPTRPSRAARQRRLDAKKRRGQIKVQRRDPPPTS